MNKKCGRCEKTVYPTEELNCLDKVWHKLCFKCQECGMTLNMRNYKGYNKLPYCEAHIPKAKATTVAETPELRRIAENTRIQSNIKYHEEFEKSKGKFTQVADDPETLRIKANTKIISNVMYHGELERKEEMEKKRSLQSDDPVHPPQAHHLSQQVYTSQPSHTQNYNKPVERISNYSQPKKEHNDSPYSARQASTLIYSSQIGSVSSVPGRKIGSIADYDPLGDYSSNGNDLSPRDSRSQMYPGYIQEPSRAMNHNNNPYQQMGIGRVYRAMYDYQAADSDEVSFRDGDVIINCTPIDEGWMTGTVQRSGHTGMLPANYVEPVN